MNDFDKKIQLIRRQKSQFFNNNNVQLKSLRNSPTIDKLVEDSDGL